MFNRATFYFDEVARRGSIRRASEYLHIAPSAVDRQIIQLERELGTTLFERTPQGLRLTAAGELLVDSVRRWRREYGRVRSQIDDLQGLRRGEVSIALVEGSAEFLATSLASFRERYPAIAYRFKVAGSQAILDFVLAGEFDIGLTFNPPDSHALRVERTLIYQLGCVVPADHPLAGRPEVSLSECADYPLVIPDDTISLRRVLNQAWGRSIGGSPRSAAEASSISLIKALVKTGAGIGMLTALDVFAETAAGEFVFLPLSDKGVSLSVLSVVSASGRTLSVPATLLIDHIAASMLQQGVPTV